MDEEKTVLDFSKFIVAQTLRARFCSLLHKPKFKGVHNLVPASQLQVPGCVLQHISKGGKFIPPVPRTPLHQLKSGLPALRRSLLLRAFFKDQPLERSKPSLCKLPSSWSPPSNKSVEQYMRLLEDSLDQFEPKSFQKQLDLDRPQSKTMAFTTRHWNCCSGLRQGLGWSNCFTRLAEKPSASTTSSRLCTV